MNFTNYTPTGESFSEFTNPSISSPFFPSNPTILAADCPLIVPMQLKISLMKLRAIVVLIISRTTGVTLSFKTDPLESVLVSSTFDSLPSVRRHLQVEIENRLRDLFQKELPAMIHSLSNDWLKRKGISRRVGEDSHNVFHSPESVSSLFPAPNRTFSPSMTDKNSAPVANRIKTPKSSSSCQKSPSIAAQSAPTEFEFKFSKLVEEPCGIVTILPEKVNTVESIEFPDSFDFVVRGSQRHQGCYSELGFSVPVDQFYFHSPRSIIVRAPTELALPDPILIDSGKLFKRKNVNVSKFFKSLFNIAEVDVDDCRISFSKNDSGLKAIEDIGSGLNESGICSVRSGSRSVIPDNCSVRSRSRSMLFDQQMNKALSTISGNRLSRFQMSHQLIRLSPSQNHPSHHQHNYIERYSEADPDLVQFEPDEFRSSDFRATESLKNNLKSKTMESLDGESQILAIKFGIMRKLQSTLATNNFEETNILYRTMSRNKK